MTAFEFLTVSQLTAVLKRMIEEQVMIEAIWIKGEISNFKAHASGHLYFTLKDANAKLSCVMFRAQTRQLTFQPENGQAVSVKGRLSVYEKAGNYQLYVERMEHDGLGGLFVAFEKLKQKLAEEGLFDPSRKRPLPHLPKQIGIITSPTGAALRDMITILRRRYSKIDILLFPAQVQGMNAPGSLVKALREAESFPGLDLVIIGRGGGSLEELWAFNDEQVARAIARFPKPVISAVGHETDFTIADFVSDLRAPTPSGAAELAVPDEEVLKRNLAALEERLLLTAKRKIQTSRIELKRMISSRGLTQPRRMIDQKRQDLDLLSERLTRAFQHRLQIKNECFKKVAGQLHALSPLAILRRGYAIAQTEDGNVVKDSEQVKIGEKIKLRLAVGALQCQVNYKEK